MNNTRSLPLVVPSTPRPRNNQPAPAGDKPEESEKFRMRRMRIRQYEREQAMEDRAAVVMIQQHRDSLLQQFASVKTEFSDLDGLSWSNPQAQMMLNHWRGSATTSRRYQGRSSSPNENQLPLDGLPVSYSSPCQLEGLGSSAYNTIRKHPTKPNVSRTTRDSAPTTTRSALTTMSSSPQLTYDPPEYSSLDLATPTREKVNGVSSFVFPPMRVDGGESDSPFTAPPCDLSMYRSAASMGDGSLILEQAGTGPGTATVRRKPTGPRHVH